MPNNPDLLNPALVDDLIIEGDVKDYSIEKKKNETIPVFNSTSIDTPDSEKTGIFYIVGLFPPKYLLLRTIQFEILLFSEQKTKFTIQK